MSDSITDRIAAIVRENDYWKDALTPGWAAYVAEVIVEQLGLSQQWASAVDDPGAPVPYTHSGDQRSDAEEDATNLDGGYVVTRYVTKWATE
jgi:hypothetical protein